MTTKIYTWDEDKVKSILQNDINSKKLSLSDSKGLKKVSSLGRFFQWIRSGFGVSKTSNKNVNQRIVSLAEYILTKKDGKNYIDRQNINKDEYFVLKSTLNRISDKDSFCSNQDKEIISNLVAELNSKVHPKIYPNKRDKISSTADLEIKLLKQQQASLEEEIKANAEGIKECQKILLSLSEDV